MWGYLRAFKYCLWHVLTYWVQAWWSRHTCRRTPVNCTAYFNECSHRKAWNELNNTHMCFGTFRTSCRLKNKFRPLKAFVKAMFKSIYVSWKWYRYVQLVLRKYLLWKCLSSVNSRNLSNWTLKCIFVFFFTLACVSEVSLGNFWMRWMTTHPSSVSLYPVQCHGSWSQSQLIMGESRMCPGLVASTLKGGHWETESHENSHLGSN